MALFNNLNITDRDDRHTITDHILGYHIETATNLTKTETNQLIDTLENWATDTDYPAEDRIREILNQATLDQAAEDADA